MYQAHVHQPHLGLTRRELEVLALVAFGASNYAITQQLVVSRRTVETHVRSIMRKLDVEADRNVNARVAIARVYWESGLHLTRVAAA